MYNIRNLSTHIFKIKIYANMFASLINGYNKNNNNKY